MTSFYFSCTKVNNNRKLNQSKTLSSGHRFEKLYFKRLDEDFFFFSSGNYCVNCALFALKMLQWCSGVTIISFTKTTDLFSKGTDKPQTVGIVAGSVAVYQIEMSQTWIWLLSCLWFEIFRLACTFEKAWLRFLFMSGFVCVGQKAEAALCLFPSPALGHQMGHIEWGAVTVADSSIISVWV